MSLPSLVGEGEVTETENMPFLSGERRVGQQPPKGTQSQRFRPPQQCQLGKQMATSSSVTLQRALCEGLITQDSDSHPASIY